MMPKLFSDRFVGLEDVMMNRFARYTASLALITAIAGSVDAAPKKSYPFTWSTVVNNGDYLPTDLCDPAEPGPAAPPCRTFNSYNQPSVSADKLVVFRARSRGERHRHLQ